MWRGYELKVLCVGVGIGEHRAADENAETGLLNGCEETRRMTGREMETQKVREMDRRMSMLRRKQSRINVIERQ